MDPYNLRYLTETRTPVGIFKGFTMTAREQRRMREKNKKKDLKEQNKIEQHKKSKQR